jgi:hypothetical protein
VTLEAEEREQLRQILSKGKADVRGLKHARILLAADESNGNTGRTDDSIADAVHAGRATVERVRRRFVEDGLELSLSPYRAPRRTYPRKLDVRTDRVLANATQRREGKSGLAVHQR